MFTVKLRFFADGPPFRAAVLIKYAALAPRTRAKQRQLGL